MDEKEINLLVPEDGLIPEGGMEENNLDKQYTEVLDFSTLNEELEKVANSNEIEPINDDYVAEPITLESNPIEEMKISAVEPIAIEETTNEDQVPNIEAVPLEQDYEIDDEVNEHPSGKVVLNKNDDEPIHNIEQEDVKFSLRDNKSLIRVLLLGLLFLVAIFVIPYFI